MSFSPIGEGFSVGSIMKNLLANAGNTGSIPGSGRSPGEGNGNSLQWSCWDDPMDRGAWWATVYRMAKELDTTKQLNNETTPIGRAGCSGKGPYFFFNPFTTLLAPRVVWAQGKISVTS